MGFPETYDARISRYLYPGLLLVCGIAFFCRLPLHMDILFSDEGNYRLIARNMFEQTDMSFGPLYSLWLKAWGLVFADPVTLYYVNYGALSVALPLLIYALLQRLQFSRHAAFFTALTFLYSTANVLMWPRVSHFALLLLIPGVLLALRIPQRHLRWLVLALTTLLVSYARAEFQSLSVLFFAAALYFTWKDRLSVKKVSTGVLLLLYIAVIGFVRGPENDYTGDGVYTRSFTAFIQHYYLGLTFEGKTFDYWWLSIKDFYYEGEFAAAKGSLVKFIQLYPAQFFHHIAFDIKMYLLQVSTKFLLLTNPLFTKAIPKYFILSFVLLLIALGLFLTHAATRFHIRELVLKNRTAIGILFLLLLPSVAACILILPRDHYVFLQLPFFIVFTGIFAETVFTRFYKLRLLLLPLAIVCLCWQSPAKFPFIQAGAKAGKHTNAELVRFLRDSLPSDKSYRLFSDNIYITGFLPERFTEPTLMEYSFEFENFPQFLADKNINLVLTTPETQREPYLRRDSTWNAFLRDPASIGFEAVPMGGTDSIFQLYRKK